MGKTPKGDKKRPAPPAAEEEVGAVGDGAEANGGEAQPQPSTSGRKYTLSLAVPSSIVDHAHSLEAAAHVVGQVARAAAAFFADEVVVFDDSRQAANGDGTVSGAAAFMARVLQYLDTPPLLRPTLLDSHPDHAAAAHLPPLQCPHHPRDAADWWEYREGVVLKSEQGEGSFVEAGLDRNVWVQQALPPRTRVTMHLGSKPATRFVPAFSETMIVGKVVPPSRPREADGLYWGYTVRLAVGLSGALKGCPYSKRGYDLTIGTSATGISVHEPAALDIPRFRHALLAFGSPHGGLAGCLERDPSWSHKTPQDVFNLYLNTMPHGQGCRAVRPEDAVLVSLAVLQPALVKFGAA